MHIHARIYRLPESVLVVGCRAVQVVNMLDVHPVADDETFESPLSAHHVLHQPAVRVARNAVQLIVCGHHRVGSGVDARFERGGKNISRIMRSERSVGEPLVPLTGWLPPTKCFTQESTRPGSEKFRP